MEQMPDLANTALSYLDQGWQLAQSWLLSPAAWSQFILLIIAFLIALFMARKAQGVLRKLLTPPEDQTHIVARLRRYFLLFLPLLLPLFAYLFTALGEGVTRSLFGSGTVIAFGKRVFLLLAVRIIVRDIIQDPFLKLMGRYVLLPAMTIFVVGLWDDLTVFLAESRVNLGNINFSLLSLLRGILAGAVLFWLGRWSNDHSHRYIHRQEELPQATRQLAAKAAEIGIFGLAFLLVLNIMGINLSALAVLGGAIGVGIGFGLQQIASNFISGIILLLEGQATIGDYVELDGGEAGTIVKIMARATVLETYDGRWIVVPNEHFITTRVVNFSDGGSANRYEAPFSVSYDTDINRVPEIIEAAVAKLDFVLDDPDLPDCELRGFGDSGIDFAVEFWVNGIDDGKNKFTPQVLFAIWNALKDAGIEIPYPHRVVEFKNSLPST